MKTTKYGLRMAVALFMVLVAGFAPRAEAVTATGGNVTNEFDGYIIHVFTNSATASNFVVEAGAGGNVEVLVVAGGGGAGKSLGGGGGAGGLIYRSAFAVLAGSNYPVVVGGGGVGGTAGSELPGQGTNSSFGSLVAYGGGRGGDDSSSGPTGGGSGGGGGSRYTQTGGSATDSGIQGNNGGNGLNSSGTYGGGGGGGAGTIGTNGTSTGQGHGGQGLYFAQFASFGGSPAGWFAGGGAGGSYQATATQGFGGNGGGGNGGNTSGNNAGSNGVANTGGGGGSASYTTGPYLAGGSGGSGIVIVRYILPTKLIVSAQPAGPIGMNFATLNGTVESVGGAENPQVYVCWDTADKGTNALTDWPNRPYLGANWGAGQSFGTNVTGLLFGTTYVYRCYATNSTGHAWSGTRSFTTIAMPSVTNLGPVARQTRAQLNGQVLDTGGETPTCWFAWWQDGSGTTNTTPMGTQTGVFTTQLSGLAPGTTYGYLVAASNGAGTVTSETRNFTMFPSGPMAWYAATNGTDGAWTNWTTAGTNLQAILDNAVSNDTIYIAGHTFGLTSQLVWTVSFVPVRGGYEAANAADHPGPNNPALWPTVIQRASGNTRILHVNGVTNGTLDQVTLTGGNMGNGAGIRIDNSVNILIANCLITNNTYMVDDYFAYGGGLYAEAGTSVTISNCMIRGNQVDSSKTHGGAASGGGGIYSAGILTVRDSVIVNNQSEATGWGNSSGGAIYFSGTRLDLRNVLLAGNDSKYTGDGLQVNGGAVSLTNVTVAGNGGEGVRLAGGTVTVKDSILWGNGVDSTGGVTIAWSCYSNSTDHVNGGNNTNANPLFVDTNYYHLKSQAGNYVGGYFSGGTWANSSESSPCIDAGDPAGDYSREPDPNGRRINMGAYGNTAVASKSRSRGTLIEIR